jgi:hypothetical protein
VNEGLMQSKNDHGLYIKNDSGFKIYILVYVDDVSIVSNSTEKLNTLKHKFNEKFKMTDKGEVSMFLNWQIVRDRKEKKIFITQANYIRRMLKSFNYDYTGKEWRPIGSIQKLSENIDNFEKEKLPYREVLGALMYLMLSTRPDLCYSVSYFSRFASNFSINHWNGLERIIKYLSSSIEKHLELSGDKINLVGYSDSTHGSLEDEGHGTTGFCFKVGNGLISWKSKKQVNVALSSCESEYVALSETAKEFIWLRNILIELGYEKNSLNVLYTDNQSAMAKALHGSTHDPPTQPTGWVRVTHHKILDPWVG